MSLASYHCSTPGSVFLLGRRRLPLAAAVPAEHPCGSKFTELVADHVLGHEQLGELPTVVDHERMANEVRHDGTIAGPRFDRVAVRSGRLAFHLVQQAQIDVRSLLQR